MYKPRRGHKIVQNKGGISDQGIKKVLKNTNDVHLGRDLFEMREDRLFGHNLQNFMELEFNEKSFDLCRICTHLKR